jgi:hypothetical protein
MRARAAHLLTLITVLTTATAAGVQVGTAQVGPGTSSTDVWQGGTQPLPGLYAPRQSPNLQPNAPAQPVSSQTSQGAWPSWYPQPVGTPVAGGTLYTGVTVGTFYDDNVFATTSNHLSDWAFFARPEAQWVTQGKNYTFSADGWVEGRDYDKFSSEDQVNGGAGFGFTVMPNDNTQIVGSARYIHQHLDRGASETVITLPGGASTLLSTLFQHPVAYDEGIESIALNNRNGNWWSSLGAAGLEVNYQNAVIGGTSPATGSLVDFSYADGVIGSANARLGYVILPLTSVFVEVAGNTRDWHVSYFNSEGYRVVGGMLFEQGPGARLKGEFWGGYMDQTYNGLSMGKISNWTYGLGLAALLNDQATLVLEGRREAKEAALGLATLMPGELGASAVTCTADAIGAVNPAVCVSTLETELGARLDYRILRNVVVGGGVTYLRDDYQGQVAFDRHDSTLGPLASVKYFVNQNVTLGFDYRNVAFSSSGGNAPLPFTSVSALPYTKNIYMLTLAAKW